MTYEDFKQLAEHPQHRDVPAIFKLEVLETEELEEKKRSHYPKYKVNTYCPQAFTTTLEEAEADEFALNATLPNADWKKFMARTRDVVPYKIAPYIQTEADKHNVNRKLVFKLPSAARFINKEGRDDSKKHHGAKVRNFIYKRTIRLSPNTYILTALLYKSIHQNLLA